MSARQLRWVAVPGGVYRLGEPAASSQARRDAAPAHRVELPAFWITRTPVTSAQYAAFAAATGARAPEHWEGTAPPAELADHPVTYVAWHAARAFCGWAGGRLPSEAEWEKAARGADGRPYPWGAEPPGPRRCNYGGQLGVTTPVGSYERGASPYGLLDMAGNICEWTASLDRQYPYDGSDGRELSAAAGPRAVRGGSFQHGPAALRCDARERLHPDACDVYLGFRVAADGPQPPSWPGLDWVEVPAGPFVMGAALDEPPVAPGDRDALPGLGAPQHAVALAPLAIGATPVTNGQYAAFVTATGRRPPGHWEDAPPPLALLDHPVTYVDWHDAMAFCAWAGARLPTEAEWEAAARGPAARLYPWGDAPPDRETTCFDRGAAAVGTWPVGRHTALASPCGALDMAGNVWEWTASLYSAYPYIAADGREDPAAPGRRVLRGGSFRSEQPIYLRCAFRSMSYPSRRRDHIGFRVAR